MKMEPFCYSDKGLGGRMLINKERIKLGENALRYTFIVIMFAYQV